MLPDLESRDRMIKILLDANKTLEDSLEKAKKQAISHQKYINEVQWQARKAEQEARENSYRTEIALEHPEFLKIFPDITYNVNRWKTKRLSSKLVTPRVTHVEVRANCGCCNDSGLEIWPYIVHGEHRIYSNPCGITVGDVFNGLSENYKERIEGKGFPDSIFSLIETQVKEYMGDDDADDEDTEL
jgi:hypothetical protein